MIEVFKTSVEEVMHAREITSLLLQHFPGSEVNFDLEDCDRILRIEGDNFSPGTVVQLLQERGFYCDILP